MKRVNKLKQENRAVAGKPRNAAVIFQDSGWLPSWIWNSVIRSADDENYTLEPNMKWIRWPIVENDMAIRNSISWGVHLRPQFFREGEVVGVVDRTIRNSDVGFL